MTYLKCPAVYLLFGCSVSTEVTFNWLSINSERKVAGSGYGSFNFEAPGENPVFWFEGNGPPVRAFSYASPLPDVPEMLQRDSGAYFKYFLSQCISELLKMLNDLKSYTHQTGTHRIRLAYPPFQEIHFYSHLNSS
jgi:hypothetical protein